MGQDVPVLVNLIGFPATLGLEELEVYIFGAPLPDFVTVGGLQLGHLPDELAFFAVLGF